MSMSIVIYWGNCVSVDNLYISDTFFETETEKRFKERMDSIISDEEYKKIWNKFDYNVIQMVCEKSKRNEGEPLSIVIKSLVEFEKALKTVGIYESYIKEKENMDKRRKALEREDLKEVKFNKFTSFETGQSFLILNQPIGEDINTLKNIGLFFHERDDENGEYFTGWCFEYSENKILEAAENGIKILEVEKIMRYINEEY